MTRIPRKRARPVVIDVGVAQVRLTAVAGVDLDTAKLPASVERVITHHTNELWGSLFHRVASDDIERGQAKTIVLTDVCSRGVCAQVVRRIARNVLAAQGRGGRP